MRNSPDRGFFGTAMLPSNVLSLSRHVPSRPRGATHRVAPDEPRKRRADERHVVGCCEELGGADLAIRTNCARLFWAVMR
jgi:hypothetical protein